MRRLLAEAGITLIYGGARTGVTGAGGAVIGIIPDFLARREVAHTGVSEMIVTDSMHSRKRRMFEMSDAFVTLPGGLGTMDETVEMITWRQLDLHAKPILICDVAGWAAPFLALVDGLIRQGFAPAASHGFYEVLDGPEAVVRRLVELPVVEEVGAVSRL
jgi:uncharacterized protein (TIGR00730 family)